jgi:beta-lactam-binding protein with PASTA domain
VHCRCVRVRRGYVLSLQPSPPNTNPAWTADGFNQWTADGFYGWTADGYEPTTLTAAVTAFALQGKNVIPTFVFDPLVPDGYVITGWPPLLASAALGSYTNLLVSQGPAPPPVVITVPNVVGLFYYQAQLALLQAGFLIAYPTFALSNTVLPQYVISQSIAPGTQFTQQTQVTIVVSGFSVLQQPGIPTPVP